MSSIMLSEPARDFVAGTMGGFASKLVDYPLDTVKVLLQTDYSSKYRGAWHCLHHTVKTNGIPSVYKGITSPLLGSMAENALLFWAYNHCKRFISSINNNDAELTVFQLALAGAGAGAVVPFVNTPVELVKCRLQVQNSATKSPHYKQYKGPIDVIIKTIKTEGLVNGLYRGNISTLWREVPGNFVWYGLYEGTCKFFIPEGGTKSDLGTSVHLFGGALAGVGYWTAFYPADTVKSMIQTNPEYFGKGFTETMRHVYRKEGVRGLYRGWGVTAARAAPAHALIFAVYEETMRLLQHVT